MILGGTLVHRAAQTGDPSPSLRERIDRHRNLGKAFYENPTTQAKAVDEFKMALDLAPESPRERLNYGLALLRAGKTEDGVRELLAAQKLDPSLPHPWFNLGIVYKKESEYEKAIAQFEQMARLVPDEPVTHYNLGVLYKLTGRGDDALRRFEMSARLNPNLAGPHFQLFNAYRAAGRTDEAASEEKIFFALRKQQTGAAVPEDLEWSFYSEVHDIVEAQAADSSPAAAIRFETQPLASRVDGLVAADVDGDGKPDLIGWSSAGVSILRGPKMAGVDAIKDVTAVVPADFDNDGLADLCVLTRTGAQLYANRKSRFERLDAKLPERAYNAAVWVDYDHDYDLDLFLLGAASVLMRNSGTAGFSDETASFPFVKGAATAGVLFDLVPDTDAFDIVVAYADRPGVLYRDRLAGKYEAIDVAAIPAGTRHLAGRDFNNDGATDLAAGSRLILNNDGKLELHRDGRDIPVAFADLENRGLGDLVTANGVLRNDGLGNMTASETKIPPARSIVAADFDGDGREDLGLITESGEAHWLKNETRTANTWLRTLLVGVKNLKLSVGAKVEVKAGSRYQKQTYLGLPLHFGLRGAKQADAVRITWANGLVQNEISKPAETQLAAKEAPRLSGSCPMIFTWNGKAYQFITDVLGVAPLGASAGDGEYFPVDHDEYVQIPGSALQPRDGYYDIRVTEELREVAYLDQIKLLAVDHPADIEVFTNDKFKAPPFPGFRLFGVRHRIPPVSARDHRGNDVLRKVLRRDRTYPDTFRRDYSGIAELHSITLDFGNAAADNRALLVLSGWVDWADGSTFRAASQQKAGGLVMPYLQVRDERGDWKTVIEDMGMPAGKPKSIVVDLSGKFLSSSREVRIITDLCVYWDEIFLSDSTDASTRVTTAELHAANLDYRGFSRVVVHPERKQPEEFVYADARPASAWGPTSGNYTRFGGVKPLLEHIDDLMIVMGSGDELRLKFDARKLPPLPSGWKRDFLLFVDGWAKDADANTALARTVEPLPFHGMSRYPYPATEKYPEDTTHREYLRTYNTRPALRLMTTLRPATRRH